MSMLLLPIYLYILILFNYMHVIFTQVINNVHVIVHSYIYIFLNGYQVLAFASKLRIFPQSVKNTLGQYSLLKDSNKNSLRSVYLWYSLISNCGASKINVPPGLKKGKSVELSQAVKKAIVDTLAESRGEIKDGRAALQRHGARVYEDLQWTLNLSTPVHTIMVWHIATSCCESHDLEGKHGGSKKSFKIDKVAIHLSNYCAYLAAFHPELLSLNSNLLKFIFRKILDETSDFFGGENLQEKCKKLTGYRDAGDQRIICLGFKLGSHLIKYDDRWKIMADFWSELILSLARGGATRVHIKQLGHGSEFITHLWALLYHAGISGTASEEYGP
jgi:Protein of unknown function, DUF594